ncbi:MAG TPA: MFS transporter [Solirubrobacterales bacterium]|nr:MFS transporter [Solirubrobacterales bacterium]
MRRDWAGFAGIFIVTNLGLLAVGATLAVLPHYVKDNLNGSDLEVGIVSGAFAFTGIVCRPIAGNLADTRGRKPTVIVGALLAAVAGGLYFVPAGIPGLLVARFFLGAGEGTVFTAGSAWNVDMAPEERRGRMIGLYGLAIWTGLTLGPPIGVLLQNAGGFHLVWAFATGAPLLGAAIAARLPEDYRPSEAAGRGPFISREALGPGATFALSVFGFAAVSAFIVLSLDERGIGHGPAVFSVFAATVVATRLLAGGLPDRIGAARCAVAAALIEAAGLTLVGAAQDLPVVIAGAIGMGAAFSLLFPSLSLVAVNRVGPERRGKAMGTFTAAFDLGMLVGSPLVGAAAAVAGYSAAFYVAAVAALLCAAISSVFVDSAEQALAGAANRSRSETGAV